MGAHRVTDCKERVLCGGRGFRRLHGKAGRGPRHLGKVAVCQACGHSVHRAPAPEGLGRHSLMACEAPLNPLRKPGCCLLSLEPAWKAQVIGNWVVCS